jgi:hypothetical protein
MPTLLRKIILAALAFTLSPILALGNSLSDPSDPKFAVRLHADSAAAGVAGGARLVPMTGRGGRRFTCAIPHGGGRDELVLGQWLYGVLWCFYRFIRRFGVILVLKWASGSYF